MGEMSSFFTGDRRCNFNDFKIDKFLQQGGWVSCCHLYDYNLLITCSLYREKYLLQLEKKMEKNVH